MEIKLNASVDVSDIERIAIEMLAVRIPDGGKLIGFLMGLCIGQLVAVGYTDEEVVELAGIMAKLSRNGKFESESKFDPLPPAN